MKLTALIATYQKIIGFLDNFTDKLPPLLLRLILAFEFWEAGMMVLTVVAVNTVHWPAEWHSLAELSKGCAIADSGYGNFKLPLIYLIMFMPLLFGGAGKWGLDCLLKRLYCNSVLNQNN